MKNVITKEIQDTLVSNPAIDAVHFDGAGKHYFRTFKLPKHEGDEDEEGWNEYGDGAFSHRQVIPGKTNVDEITEEVSRGLQATRIVETISREDALSAKVKQEGTDLATQVMNLDDIGKKKIALALGIDMDAINALIQSKAADAPAQKAAPAATPPQTKK